MQREKEMSRSLYAQENIQHFVFQNIAKKNPHKTNKQKKGLNPHNIQIKICMMFALLYIPVQNTKSIQIHGLLLYFGRKQGNLQ